MPAAAKGPLSRPASPTTAAASTCSHMTILEYEPLYFTGPRTAKGIASAAIAALHDKLISRPTTLEAFSAFLQSSDLPKVTPATS